LGHLVSSSGDFKIIGEAADGQQACELAAQLQPDIALMDVEMPKMNGIDATRWIKTTHPHLIVIGLSIHQSVAVANTMKAAGASAYVTKDVKPEDLHRVIRSALFS
jgi:DNA-binding NarL/FixJ family response regulator